MKFDLKPLSAEAIPRALEKAERYRLLNEPAEAESICLDVLHIEPDNQSALVILLLAITDQFPVRAAVRQAHDVLPRLRSEFDRTYYEGIICERRAKAHLSQGTPGCEAAAYDWFRRAMECYEKAETLRQPENDDATLRWNTCARILMANPRLASKTEERIELPLE